MDKYTIIDHPTSGMWEKFLQDYTLGNLQQSFEYGEAIKESNPHAKILRFLAINDDNLAGLIQARYNKRFGFGDRTEVGGVYGYGPVVGTDNRKEVLEKLMGLLEKHAIQNRVSEANIYAPETNQTLENMGYTVNTVFNVYKVDLRKSETELWKTITHNKRRNIKKAQKQGAKVVQCNNYDALASFFELHAISAKRVGFKTYPFIYFQSLSKIFGKRNNLKIFLTVFEGQPVAGVFVVLHGKTAYALGTGSREESWHVRPNDLLHWETMKWACNNGFSWYHMGHVREPLPNENSEGWGLWRWKREWKGQLNKVYLYNKVYMPKFNKFVLSLCEKFLAVFL
ncbi:MAG: GNAT family N-acetyltransferase [Candidatus Bathyarchaeota archaeon]|nr:GNAT family N-acetyltransferase [Candidatus Bathyarchaeum sp.]